MQEICVHQPDWQGGNIYRDKWSFNQLPGQGKDWAHTVGNAANAHDDYKAVQVGATWGGGWGVAGALKDSYEEGAGAPRHGEPGLQDAAVPGPGHFNIMYYV